jgi:hypothetical protein
VIIPYTPVGPEMIVTRDLKIGQVERKVASLIAFTPFVLDIIIFLLTLKKEAYTNNTTNIDRKVYPTHNFSLQQKHEQKLTQDKMAEISGILPSCTFPYSSPQALSIVYFYLALTKSVFFGIY